ncbi:UBX-domain-containing protein [Ramaria rubella]|nr:UBX-domain-containing protein [Ramaria rubella]
MSDDLDELTTSQREALGQLQAITNGADIPSEIAILSSVGWDVQRAAEAIFDSQSSIRPKMEQMQLDDSAQRVPPPNQSHSPISRIGLNLVSLVTFPLSLSLNVLSHLFHFIFRILRIPFPRLGNISLNFSSIIGRPSGPRAHIPDDPASVADRFVRELEDETGAMTVSRARALRRENETGPSSSAAEQDVLLDPGRKLLPDFWLGSYESALDAVKREARVLCVVLLSDEHDDTPEFRRSVLTDPELVRVLTENEFIVWAGEIRQSEGYQASMKLTATTYPFVAFISLQPRARPSSSSPSTSNHSLAILSRHSGKTTAATLVTHITDTLLPRMTPFLSRLQAQARARETDRLLRQEQDSAFRASERADAERILRRRAEEAEKTAREEAVRQVELEKKNQEEKRKRWRRWAQRHLGDEPSSGVRIGVRLPDGRRAIRRFNESDDLEVLYTFVDGQLYPDDGEGNGGENAPSDYVHQWEFKLAVAFPRREVPYLRGQKVGDVDSLRGGANLVVEGFDRGDAGESDGSED